MDALSETLRGDGTNVAFWCPACGQPHLVEVSLWDGNLDRPTIAGEIIADSAGGALPGGRLADDAQQPEAPMVACRSTLTSGRLLFLASSSHHLAGRSGPPVPWPEP